MLQRTRQIVFDQDGAQASITVRRQDTFDELVYRQLRDAALSAPAPEFNLQEQDGPAQELARLRANAETMATTAAKRLWWPGVMAVTVSAAGSLEGVSWAWPMSLMQWLGLPGELLEAWLSAVWELNPEWRPVFPGDPVAEEKKSDVPPENSPIG